MGVHPLAMTDEHFRELRQLILDLAVRVESLELHLKKQDEIATHRHGLVYEWCAPARYKAMVETVEIDIPADLRKYFPQN